MEQLTVIQLIAIWALPILFAVTVHEAAHGFMAHLLGDKTAMVLGRLSLNPLKHIDPVGTILVPIILLMLGGFIFGWAKPVPISAENLRNPKRDLALIAAAGPLANFFMMIIWALLAKFGIFLAHQGLEWALAIFYMGGAGVVINSLLMVLNLLPIPPLDGGHVVMGFLPKSWVVRLHRFEPYGFFVLLLLLVTGILKYLIGPPIFLMQEFVSRLFGL